MRSRPRRRLVLSVLACTVLLAALAGAYTYDTSQHLDAVARNVELDGSLIGGAEGDQLTEAIAATAQAWDDVPVTIATPAGDFASTLGELGVHLDRAEAANAALEAGRDASAVGRFWSWLTSPVAKRQVPLTFRADTAQTARGIAEAEAANHRDPVEPQLTPGSQTIGMVPGEVGATLDPEAIAEAARAAAQEGEREIRVEVDTVPLPPNVSDERAEQLAVQATRLATTPIGIYVGERSGRVDAQVLRSWFVPSIVDGELTVAIDAEKAGADISRTLGEVGSPPVQLRFEVGENDEVEIIEGLPGWVCCTEESFERIVPALEAEADRVDLDLALVAPDHDREWAQALGIVEPIGTFTTRHPCCAPRVQNIHRFADLIRGTVILPGETMSANDVVGQRTEERGFVSAPVIVNGKFEDAVGGGVSQFAVTMFNAAFYGGLDIPEYQAHTIYIDRYPYGVESTISWGGPDLKIHNNTPYGVLVWPTYTDTSITVTLYSTPWIKGEQGDQTTSARGACTRVVTKRIRTLLGTGEESVDEFVALYQPEEGVTC